MSTVYHVDRALLNLNAICDLQNSFKRLIILIMITDIENSLTPSSNCDKFIDVHMSITTSEIMDAPEQNSL